MVPSHPQSAPSTNWRSISRLIQDSSVCWFGKINILSQVPFIFPIAFRAPSPTPSLHLGHVVRGPWFPVHKMLNVWWRLVQSGWRPTLSTLPLRGLMPLPSLWVNLSLSVFYGGGQVFRVEGQVCILPQFTQLGYVSTVTLSFIFCHLCHLIIIRVPPLVEGE